jgi:hypothetical protein
MSVVLDLPPELETELAAEAGPCGLSLADYILRLLATGRTPGRSPRTGAELLAYWQSEGLVGMRPEIVPDHLKRAKTYHDAIHRILLYEWDPIGVADAPEAHDEYDSYVGQVYVLLIHHEPRHGVFDYLWWAETKHMGLRGSRQRTDGIVQRLIDLRDHMESA